MRSRWWLTLLTLALAAGCSDSRAVRVQTPLATGSVQDQLDAVARAGLTNLLGRIL